MTQSSSTTAAAAAAVARSAAAVVAGAGVPIVPRTGDRCWPSPSPSMIRRVSPRRPTGCRAREPTCAHSVGCSAVTFSLFCTANVSDARGAEKKKKKTFKIRSVLVFVVRLIYYTRRYFCPEAVTCTFDTGSVVKHSDSHLLRVA